MVRGDFVRGGVGFDGRVPDEFGEPGVYSGAGLAADELRLTSGSDCVTVGSNSDLPSC